KKIPLVGEALGALGEAAMGFLGTAMGTVEKYSPGTAQRFGLAKEDTLAVIGRTMTPVMETFTQFTRLVGDFLATVLPKANEMREILAPINQAMRELRPAFAGLAQILKVDVIVNLKLFSANLQAIAYIMKNSP